MSASVKRISPEEFLREERDKTLAAMRSRLAIAEARVSALEKEASAIDRIVEQARIGISAMPTVPAPVRKPKKSKHKIVESAVVLASCWHIGEVVRRESTGGLGQYDFDIFTRRLQHLVDTVIKHTTENLQGYEFDELWFVHTGDFVSGIIHEELRSTNCLNIVEQAFLGAWVTAQALRELCAAFPQVHFLGVIGNHGRTGEKYYWKEKAQVNWDYVAYNTLALLLQNQKNIRFYIPQSFWAGFSVKGYFFHVSHGDTVRAWSGIPFYGLAREVARWAELSAARGQFYHYYIRSHFHTKGTIQTAIGENILNGSMKGPDEYGLGLALATQPRQLLFGVHPKHGKTWELSIDFAEIPSKSRYTYDRSRSLGEQV